MLHVGARTMFILESLTRSIRVPLSMLLYIVYIEPLLIYIEQKIVGLILPNIPPCLEAYCDDVNFVTGNDADLVAVDEAVKKFEALVVLLFPEIKSVK